MTALLSPKGDRADGERRCERALAWWRLHRAVLVRRLQRAYLNLLLTRGASTSDPVRAVVPIPARTDPRLVGAAVRALTKLRLIRRAGLSRSVRPVAHGRDLPVWEVADQAGARAWLSANPELPDPKPADQQPTLFD